VFVTQIMDWTGHDEKTWDPNIPEELAKIRIFFSEKLKKGYRAFIFDTEGKPKQINEFDENAERLVMVSPKSVLLAPNMGG